jgi:curli biogenesis system outer membrane secretion channel CsgG
MAMFKPSVACLAVSFMISSALAQAPPQAQKRRVAVMSFGYGTVMTSVQAVFGTNRDVGKGISDLVIDRLINDGTYRVIEREMINKIMQEQNFSNSDRVDANSAAKIGKILGVDTMIVGDITQFGRDDHNTSAGGALGGWDKYGIGKFGVKKSKAVVAVTARMIDVNTAEILASSSGKGESTRSGTNLLGGGGDWSTNGTGALDMGSSNFSQTILGEAVNQAVTQLCSQLVANSGKLPVQTAPVVKIEGLVADATGGTMIVNVGSKSGLRVGDKLAVTRVLRTIKDPVTGKNLRTVDEKLGDLTITSVDADSAEGTFSGTGAPKVGDSVKSST